MWSLRRILFLVVAAVGMFSLTSGCAFITAQRVGTFAAKQVATHVVKKTIKKSQEDRDQKKERQHEESREETDSKAE